MSQLFSKFTNAHLQWITKLTAAMYGGNMPDRDKSASDNACPLGQWIYGEGKQYETVDGFSDLIEKHRRFHASVGDIIDMVQAGKIDEAKKNITSGEFHTLSKEVVRLLSKLKTTCNHD